MPVAKKFLKGMVRLFYWLRLWQLFLIVERHIGWKRSVVCLYYHSISRQPPKNALSGLECGLAASVLDTHLNHLCKWLQPIDDRQLLTWFDGGDTFDRDALLVTFDDGYEDNRRVAGPILLKYGVPGLIFIATDYVGTGREYWWSQLSNLLRVVDGEGWKSLLNSSLPDEVKTIVRDEKLDCWESRWRARRRLARYINRTRSIQEVLCELKTLVDVVPSSVLGVLDWAEMREMQHNGFSFGGHTHSHPMLSQLTAEEIEQELTKCQKILTRQLGKAVCSMAYPAGDYDNRVIAQVEQCGYRLAFTTKPGVITRESKHQEIPRVSLGVSSPHDLCFAVVAFCFAKYLPKRISRAIVKFATN